MNVQRFNARSSREALQLVRQVLGDDAVVLSTRPGPEGVEVLAMAPEGMKMLERAATQAPRPAALLDNGAGWTSRSEDIAQRLRSAAPDKPAAARQEPTLPPPAHSAAQPAATGEVERDVQQLTMSTLSFQDYVRERMLKRRMAEKTAEQAAAVVARKAAARSVPAAPTRAQPPVRDIASALRPGRDAAIAAAAVQRPSGEPAPPPRSYREPPVLRDEVQLADDARSGDAARSEVLAAQRERHEMMSELRSVKGLIEERFGALAFMEKLQRNPRQAALSQKLLEAGFSPALIRKLVQALPADTVDELAWATGVLERNLLTDEEEPALEELGGVYALIGSTGVGKTTSTAKIAAAFATRHGAGQLGLVTLDAYRVAAHEQLRTYGRILGVPVHTAHDRASLEDLLELLAGKKMVLIDTAGMAQRDSRTRELLDMLSHRAIQKLLVVNAAAQGETIEDVMLSYRAASCRGVIVSKLDEAMKAGPALDALIRHRLKVVGVANGQRVPEDWHRLSSQALVQRALRSGGNSTWRLDAGEVNLVLAATLMRPTAAALGA